MRKITQVVSFENINLLNRWMSKNKHEYVDLKICSPEEGVAYFFLIVKIEIDG